MEFRAPNPLSQPRWHEVRFVCMSVSTLYKEGNAKQKTIKPVAFIMEQLTITIKNNMRRISISLRNSLSPTFLEKPTVTWFELSAEVLLFYAFISFFFKLLLVFSPA